MLTFIIKNKMMQDTVFHPESLIESAKKKKKKYQSTNVMQKVIQNLWLSTINKSKLT